MARLSKQATPWIASFRQRLDEMLALIENSFPGGCEIYLADIYDPTDGVGDAPSIYLPHWQDGLAIHAQYNAAIRDCVSHEVISISYRFTGLFSVTARTVASSGVPTTQSRSALLVFLATSKIPMIVDTMLFAVSF